MKRSLHAFFLSGLHRGSGRAARAGGGSFPRSSIQAMSSTRSSAMRSSGIRAVPPIMSGAIYREPSTSTTSAAYCVTRIRRTISRWTKWSSCSGGWHRPRERNHRIRRESESRVLRARDVAVLAGGNAKVYHGGLDEWKSAGQPVTTEPTKLAQFR